MRDPQCDVDWSTREFCEHCQRETEGEGYGNTGFRNPTHFEFRCYECDKFTQVEIDPY